MTNNLYNINTLKKDSEEELKKLIHYRDQLIEDREKINASYKNRPPLDIISQWIFAYFTTNQKIWFIEETLKDINSDDTV